MESALTAGGKKRGGDDRGWFPGRRCPPSPSEDVLDADLHRAVAETRRDEPEIGKRRVVHGVAEPGAVEDIERLEPEVDMLPSRDRERLAERHVQFPEARVAQEVLLEVRRVRTGS